MSRRLIYKFRLYVAGDAPNSTLALTNLNELCQTHLLNCHVIEIIDVLKHPERALVDGIFMTPTLVKLAPTPVRHIVGSLSQVQPVLRALGLTGVEP